MSTNLYWRPKPTVKKEHDLNSGLKYALARGGYFQYDGSMSEDWITLNGADIPFLKGVSTSNIDELARDTKRFIEVIEKYGEVEVCIQ